MGGYDIKPKPTKYKNRLYRSRLEARWAAFFDLFKINYEYEPFDLDGWSPDFLLKFPLSDLTGIKNVLVEVKPTDLITFDLHRKMIDATRESDYKLLLLSSECISKFHGMEMGFDGIMPMSKGGIYTHDNKQYHEFMVSYPSFHKDGEVVFLDWGNPCLEQIEWEQISDQTLKKIWSDAANIVMFLKPDKNA